MTKTDTSLETAETQQDTGPIIDNINGIKAKMAANDATDNGGVNQQLIDLCPNCDANLLLIIEV